jgi:phosphoribosylaminoimidazole-succinocarboxamide synthase
VSALLSVTIPGLPEPRRGKVRDVYDLGDCLLIVSSDRLSAFDVVMANGVPDKGRILNQLSLFWFEKLGSQAPHHVISGDPAVIAERLGFDRPELRGRCILARKAQPLTIECIARGNLTGSLFKEYRQHGGSVHGFALPEGLVDGDRLETAIFTPATKAESGHDENI